MAEIKTGIFAKNVQKRLSRAQEKVLQKLGKADETKDDHFDQAVQNFKRQETEGSRLQREMKAYLAAVKAMQQASINLTESLHEVYEPDWHGKDDVLSIGKNCDALWEDFHQKLVDSSLSTLDTYLQQFPDLKIRVAKRSRKLIDYDSARHHLETIQAVANRSDRKVTKAEEELKKAQKVFDELNVGLQDELPTLWDSRVGFYVNTFKNVTSLEAKFHREISVLCRQLYEVMTKLGEQHSDKMFTIQGAPSDSGPLRLSRAPSPPDSDSDESPGTTPNHMLAPISPGPPRPKSPSGQLKKGPPVPPPPKTPTKELHQEQIIDLFGGQFLPAASPSQPNERPGESLLDLDFDPFKPDTNAPIGQAVSPLTQQLPWDLWTGSVEPVQPAEDSGFAPNWAADFSAAPENGDTVPPATEGAAEELPTATGKEEAQSWPSEDGWGGEAAGQPQGAESATAGDEVSGWDPDPQLTPDCDPCAVGGDREARQEPPAAESWGWDVGMGGEGGSGDAESGGWEGGMGGEGGSGVIEPGDRLEPASRGGQADSEAAEAGWRDRRKSTPGLRITNEHGQVIVDTPEGSEPSLYLAHSDGREGFGSGSEYETAEEGGDAAGQNGGWASADEDLDTVAEQALPDTSTALGGSVVWEAGDAAPLVPELKASANDTGFVAHWDQPAEQAPLQSKENVEAIADPICVQELGCTGVEVLDFGADPFAEISGGGGFVTDPFAETPGGFASDPFGGGAFESDPFAETQGGGADVGFVTDPFAETTGESVAGWAADPFANSDSAQWADFPTPSTETGRTDDSGSWQEVSDSSGFFSSGSDVSQAGNLFASFPGPGREAVDQGGVVRRAHKEPENSDLSEDEVANRRYGKLYQEIDTEKEEVTSNAFNGFPQMEATAPTFVADFDKLEKMPIPSVVIEPASSNEGDDDRDIVDIISPTAISDNGVISDSQAAKNINASDGPPGLPPGYLYKVETLHDFEAANSDELDLKRGDIVLVVPTATVEDQDAGWLTGIKESDWLHLGACAHQGLFPENFTQRLE
uniref:Amphiphysin n=1 Tax=Esox lucius TaxID=8010 RepID=A0A3P8YMM7_ESOLU